MANTINNLTIARKDGSLNVGVGYNALTSNTSGNINVGIGYNSLSSTSTSGGNTGVGAYSLTSNTGVNNTSVGALSLQYNTSGDYNVAVGNDALKNKMKREGMFSTDKIDEIQVIIVCMDDDDFYPANVIERRLATIGNAECSYASTIACYNLFKRVSFINSPNVYDLPHKRVSEATLFFKRSFWDERGFGVDMSCVI